MMYSTSVNWYVLNNCIIWLTMVACQHFVSCLNYVYMYNFYIMNISDTIFAPVNPGVACSSNVVPPLSLPHILYAYTATRTAVAVASTSTNITTTNTILIIRKGVFLVFLMCMFVGIVMIGVLEPVQY